jgi:DNA primase
MRFDDRLLEDIKARIPPSRLIGKSVGLMRAGANYKALSPFTKEKTPSFYVNDEKRIFKCFSSGLGGDIFKWLMLTEGLSFPEAVERLAAEAGVSLPERDPETAKRDQHRRELIDWLEASQAFFAESLRAGVGKEARDYLIRRGVPQDDWSRFEIGYAPDGWEALTQHLKKKGAKNNDLLGAGLVRESSRGDGGVYDAFRNRVTFAIRDPSGKLVGFGARALAKDEKAKYINSPESEVFKKGEVLYRYPEARKAASTGGREAARRGLVIVEGYMDAIALAQAGVGETVASLGTALTPEQIELAWRAGPRPTLLLDGDNAGISASYRVAERVLAKLEPGRTMRFSRLQGVKDPDDLVRAEGLDGVRRVLDAAVGLDAIVWEKALRDHPVAGPDDAAELEEALKRDVNRIEHAGVRAQYRAALLDKFSETYGFKSRRTKLRPGGRRGGQAFRGEGEFDDARPETKSRPFGPGAAADVRDQGRLLHALLDRPTLVELVFEQLAGADFPHEELASLRDALIATAERQEDVDKIALERHLAQLGVELIAARVRDEPTFASAPIVSERQDDQTAALAWLRESRLYHQRLHAREERRDLKDAALAGVDAGDRESQRRFAAAARALAAARADGSAEAGAESGEDGKDRFDAAIRALDAARDQKRRKRRP